MGDRHPLAWAALGVAVLVWACTTNRVPGDQVIGLYAFTATPVTGADGGLDWSCRLPEVSTNPISFQATLSMRSDGTRAWMTMSGVSRDASWDGVVFTSTASAPRTFTQCAGTDASLGCATVAVETVQLALLSASQAGALGFACPAHPLDGGVPTDAGLTGPRQTDSGFDAVMACGELFDTIEAAPDSGACLPGCLPCATHFSLSGELQ